MEHPETIAEELPFAPVFDANGVMVRLGIDKKLPAAHGTVLGWQVPESGVPSGNFSSQESASNASKLDQDESDHWTAPTGARVAC